MAQNARFSRVGLVGAGFLSILASSAMSSTAQAGFFDQLFGGSQPTQSYEPAQPQQQPQIEVQPEPFLVPQRRLTKRVAVEERPVLQKTTDLMHDKTLRPGDAVMMKGGLRVFTGRDAAVHHSTDFAPLDEANRLKPSERVALASLDVTRNDPFARGATPDTLSSGRSAAVSSPIVAGVKFTDQRGQTIRYIGP